MPLAAVPDFLPALPEMALAGAAMLLLLIGVFSTIAALLAGVGLYGVLATVVRQRTAEIGVRMALGATRAHVILAVCRQALTPIVAGIMVGVPAATFGGSVISSQLYGVDGWNGLIVAVAAMTLTACAILAAVIPAHRAGAIDPLEALRAD